MKSILLLFLLMSSLWAAQIPDGAWNGKLWNRSDLLAGVKKEDPDALAEWAYCSRRGLLRIPYDKKLIYERAKKAAGMGSLSGKRLLAKCIRLGIGVEPDIKKGFEEAARLEKQGCPDARVDMAFDYMTGNSVAKKDYVMAERLLKKAETEGSFRAVHALADLKKRRGYAAYNIQESYRLMVKAFNLVRDVHTAGEIYYAIVYDRSQSHKNIITDDIISEAQEVIHAGMQLKNPSAFFTQSYYELNHPDGDRHRGTMLQIRAANMGNAAAMKNMTKWFSQGLKKEYGGEYQILAMGNYLDSQKTAKYAYDRGERNRTVTLNYAKQLVWFKGKGRQEKHKLSEKILRKLIADGDCNAHDILGIQRLFAHEKFKGPKEESEVGLAHLTYHSGHSGYATYLLGLYFSSDKKAPTYAPVKGAAVSQYYLEKYTDKNNNSEIKAAKKWLKLKGKFTDDQKREFKRLVDAGYPAAETYRRAAFKLLKKAGDLPPNWKFDQ